MKPITELLALHLAVARKNIDWFTRFREDLKLTKTDCIAMVNTIEREYGVAIPEPRRVEIAGCATIHDLVLHLRALGVEEECLI